MRNEKGQFVKGEFFGVRSRPDMLGNANPMRNPEVAKRNGDLRRGRVGWFHGKKRPDQAQFMREHNPMQNPESRRKIRIANKGSKHQVAYDLVRKNPKSHNVVVKSRVEELRLSGADVLFVDGGFARPDIIYILNGKLVAEDLKTSYGKLVRIEKDFERNL